MRTASAVSVRCGALATIRSMGCGRPITPRSSRTSHWKAPSAVTPMHSGDGHVTVDAGVEIPVQADAEVWTVGAVILNRQGAAFAQKRSHDRRLFPDTWDIVGGHVEPGESLMSALAREVEEETGWRLRRVRRLLGVSSWTGDDGRGVRHEADYLVDVDGDLDHPELEWAKHSAYGWFSPDNLHRLKENCPPGNYLIHDLLAQAQAQAQALEQEQGQNRP